jgi:formate dehydrogenase
MMSPTLVPEEVLVDHPDRIRCDHRRGSNPILSYSDAARWREAREKLDLLVVIDPAMTETARLADYVLPVPTGYEKWETASFPRGAPEIYVQVRPPVARAAHPGADRARDLRAARRGDEPVRPPPAELFALAENAHTPEGAMAYMMAGAGGRRRREPAHLLDRIARSARTWHRRRSPRCGSSRS